MWGRLMSRRFHTRNGPHQSFLVAVVDTTSLEHTVRARPPSATAVFTLAQMNQSSCGPT